MLYYLGTPLTLLLAILFPYALITAIRTEDESKRIFHTLFSCIAFCGVTAGLLLL